MVLNPTTDTLSYSHFTRIYPSSEGVDPYQWALILVSGIRQHVVTDHGHLTSLLLGDYNMMRCDVARILSGIPNGYVVTTVAITTQCLMLSGASPLCISSRLIRERALTLPLCGIGTTRICAARFGRILAHNLFD